MESSSGAAISPPTVNDADPLGQTNESLNQTSTTASVAVEEEKSNTTESPTAVKKSSLRASKTVINATVREVETSSRHQSILIHPPGSIQPAQIVENDDGKIEVLSKEEVIEHHSKHHGHVHIGENEVKVEVHTQEDIDDLEQHKKHHGHIHIGVDEVKVEVHTQDEIDAEFAAEQDKGKSHHHHHFHHPHVHIDKDDGNPTDDGDESRRKSDGQTSKDADHTLDQDAARQEIITVFSPDHKRQSQEDSSPNVEAKAVKTEMRKSLVRRASELPTMSKRGVRMSMVGTAGEENGLADGENVTVHDNDGDDNNSIDIFAAEGMFDDEFERKREKQQRKVQINKGELKTLQQVFAKDDKKQDFFLESVLASHHMKELTSRYGSKQKNVRQFFLESVDADTRAAVFGPSQIQDTRESLRRPEPKKFQVTGNVDLDDDLAGAGEPEVKTPTCCRKQKPDMPLGDGLDDDFWEPLYKIEKEQGLYRDDLCDGGREKTIFEILHSNWKQKPLKRSGPEAAKKPSFVQQSLEPFPDKYLEQGVQEVIQSEAVKRLWDIINSQLELFNAKDPLAYEMFGVLFDEVRAFVKLPEEDIADFNNGVWEPEPLDEKKILLMEPSEKLLTRFGVYQKAFCFLAQHFETITPMFAEVKQAYEDVFDKGEKETLEVEKEKMEELELRQTLGKYVRHTDKAGHRLLVQVKAEAHALQEHLQWQHHTLHTILGMLWKMRSSLKVTSWAVTQLKGLHKTKIEALAREIVSTQGQMLFDMALPGKYTEIMQRIRNQADPKEIRQMLLAVRRQLKKAHKKIVIYEADYADTVPKSEFEVPQKKFGIISKKNQALQETCNSLKTERQRLKQAIAALKSDIYETSGLVKDLRRKPTPRPSWTKISNEWPEGQPKFMQIREGNSTREVINKVVEKLTGKPVGEVSVFMKPLGRGDHVPPYLRYDKPLLDRSFTAVEAGMFVKDIWQKRVEIVKLYRIIKQARRDEEEGIASYPEDLQYEYPVVGTFPEYVTEYFEKRCHLEQIRMEWIYNLIDACRRHSTDLKLVQFKGTLDGFIDESIYHLFHMELDKLRDVMYAKANESYEHKGYVQWPDLIKNIYRLYPAKTEEEIAVINQMGTSLGVRGTWAVVRIQLLFEADDNGKESDFVELLYKQFENERHLYIRDIYMEILTELGISEKLLDHKDDPVWQTDVSMHMFYAGVTSVDPTIPDVKLIAYLAWVYLGVTALPGVASLGTKLVDFLRERAYLTEADLEKYNEDEDIEFENCIKEIRDYEDEESTMDKLDLKKRRLATKKLKFASLRQVMDRLYSGPFLRYGLRAVKNKPEDSETDPEKRRQHKQGQDEDDGEEDGDVAVADI